MFELLDLAVQEIELAKRLGVDTVFWLGDIFDSRTSQRQEVLTCLSEIINFYSEAEISIYCIPGNHDKTDYTLDESFLIPYKYHPGFVLCEKPTFLNFKGFEFLLIPYYTPNIWLEKFKEVYEEPCDFLLSHAAVCGSVNNDGKEVENDIKTSLFVNYKKVFLGHYHNAQQPARNVFHIPSTRQNNFGEDEEKGFTVLYDDCSHEFVKARFKPYREIKVDCGTVTKEEIIKLAKTENKDVNLRITLCGTQESVKAVNKKLFTDNGISVKTKYSDVDVNEVEEQEMAQEYTGEDIKQVFKNFCETKGYDYKQGLPLLKEIMQWQE